MTSSLVLALQERATLEPEQEALRFLAEDGGTEALTCRQLEARARAMAALLQERAAPGDRVLLLLPSGLDYVAGFYGCLFAGVIAVPAYPPQSTQPQHLERLRLIVEDAEPRLILAEPAMCEAIGDAFGARATVLAAAAPAPDAESAWRRPDLRPDDVAFLQYTSGSTAAPKGVQVTHSNLVANERLIQHGFGLGQGDTMVSWLPLYHDMGLIGGLLQPVFVGYRCVLMSPRYFLERPVRWLEAISRHRGTISGGPDFAYRLCSERVPESAVRGLDLGSWDIAYSGAEPIRPDTLDAFAARFAPAGFRARSFFGCYGLAEATLLVTAVGRGNGTPRQACDAAALAGHRLRPGDGAILMGSGRPLPDHEVRVVEPLAATPLADGGIGEIQVAGPSVAKGYWRKPEATAAAFVEADGRTWLRTGDLGVLHQGQLYVTGRLKDMLIVRGQNIYPQDLERAVEDRAPMVRKGRVAAFAVERDGGEAIGIAAEVGRGARKRQAPEALVRAIREAVADDCGEAAAVVALLNPGALPRTSSGKLQRRACAAGLLDGSLDSYFVGDGASSAGGRAPETAAERLLAGIWAELLGVEPGAEDRFLALGGSSITAMQMLARLRHQGEIVLSLRELLQARTLAELALAVERAPAAEDRGTSPLPAPAAGPQPASFAQERIWFFSQLHPQSALYNVPGAARLTGTLDIDALQRSLDRPVARHQALRTHFAADGELLQVVAPAAPVPLRLDDLSQMPAAAREQKARELAEEEARLPFDLARGPLLRLRLLRLDAGEHIMLLTLHHVAVDGWSLRVLMEELGLLYAGLRSGQPVRLPELPLTYADVARWQRERLAAGGIRRQLDYWRRRLGGDSAVLELPGDRALPQDGQEGVRHELTIEAGLTARLRAFAQAGGFTLFMLLLAAFAVVLRERTGRARVRIGGDVAGRSDPRLERLVGFFVNQVVLQVDLDDAATARALLEQCRMVVIEATEHQDLPFNSLVEALRPPRREGRSPFFSIKLLYQEGADPLPRLEGLAVEPYAAGTPGAELDLVASFTHAAGTIRASFLCPRDLFEPATIASLFEATRAVLAALVDCVAAHRAPERPQPVLPQLRKAARARTPALQAS